MKASKIFYILNLLLVINSIIPCFCGAKNYDKVKELERTLENIKEKAIKRKKVLMYSSIAAAVSAAVLITLGLSIQYKKRKAENIWLDEDKMEKMHEILKDIREEYKGKKIDKSVENIEEVFNEFINKKKYGFNSYEINECKKVFKMIIAIQED